MGDEDPFAWISAQCHISASQEKILRNAPFALSNCAVGSEAKVEERMSSEDEEDEMRDVETVVMVSVSESSDEGNGEEEEEEEYRTPPERHSHSLTSSNEARIGVGEDGGEDEVDCGGHESREKTVDLGRDSEVEFRVEKLRVCEDELVEKGECFTRDVRFSENVNFGDSIYGSVNLGDSTAKGRYECTGGIAGTNNGVEDNLVEMEEDKMPSEGFGGVTRGVEGRQEGVEAVEGSENCDEDNLMDMNVNMEDGEPFKGFGGATRDVEGRQEGTGAVGGSEKCVENRPMDVDLMMEEDGVMPSGCGGGTRGVEVVAEGHPGSSVKAAIMRSFGNTEIESNMRSGDEVMGKNELQCKGKDVVREVEMVRSEAISKRLSGNSSLEFRILPPSFCTGSKGDGGVGTSQVSGRERNDRGQTSHGVSRAGTSGGNGSAGAGKGDNEPGTGDPDGAAGNRASEPNGNDEPNEEELKKNILKVLGFLAKSRRPVYKERVDIIGSAIKAGITFPRPSWWPEDSDDDSD